MDWGAAMQPARHLEEDADLNPVGDGRQRALVTRHVHDTVLPAIEYRLTALGLRFLEPVELLYAWARVNADALNQLGSRPISKR